MTYPAHSCVYPCQPLGCGLVAFLSLSRNWAKLKPETGLFPNRGGRNNNAMAVAHRLAATKGVILRVDIRFPTPGKAHKKTLCYHQKIRVVSSFRLVLPPFTINGESFSFFKFLLCIISKVKYLKKSQKNLKFKTEQVYGMKKQEENSTLGIHKFESGSRIAR
jgi:hypothetical protein